MSRLAWFALGIVVGVAGVVVVVAWPYYGPTGLPYVEPWGGQ